jgi:hypothetical protein
MPTFPLRLSILCAALLAIPFFQTAVAAAQSATPTNNILFRVLMVRSQFDYGTIFSIDVDQREYWITAKHILTGAKHPPYGSVASQTVTLKILSPDASRETWLPETFSVIDPGKDIDIIVLAPREPLLTEPIPTLPAESNGVVIGGDCSFLGFPASIAGVWRARFSEQGAWFWMPFIKHCTVSGRFVEPLNYWVLDGINNPGFSGGPVVFLTGPAQKILGVVSGYYSEPTDVVAAALPNKTVPPKKPNSSQSSPTKKLTQSSKLAAEKSKQIVNTNSGFMIAFDITYAVEAIKKHPIGPLRTALGSK